MKLNTQYNGVRVSQHELVKIYDQDLFDIINEKLTGRSVRIGMLYKSSIPVIYHFNDEINTLTGEKYIRYVFCTHQYTPEIGDMLVSPTISKKMYKAICKLFQKYYICDTYSSTNTDSAQSDQNSELVCKTFGGTLND